MNDYHMAFVVVIILLLGIAERLHVKGMYLLFGVIGLALLVITDIAASIRALS